MMKMAMRPDKSQYGPTLIKYTATGQFVDRNRALMFGYRNYEMFLVGAAGGYSGQASGATYQGTFTTYAAAPGGGGCLHLAGKIIDLSTVENVTVGLAGANGSSTSTVGVKAGDGVVGGNTSFKGHSAYGGLGGVGDRWNKGPSGHPDSYNSKGYGGHGGGNSAGLGAGGVRGSGGWYYHSADTGSTSTTVSVVPTAGTFVVGGTAPVVGGGKGGGGGTGDNTAVPGDVPRAGATGASSAHSAAGGPINVSVGGSGGGADLFDFTGIVEYYGNNIAGKNRDGVAVLILS